MPTGLQQPAKGVASWNGMRTHHMDAHLLGNGTWVAAIDGDSMYSVRPNICNTRSLSFVGATSGQYCMMHLLKANDDERASVHAVAPATCLKAETWA